MMVPMLPAFVIPLFVPHLSMALIFRVLRRTTLFFFLFHNDSSRFYRSITLPLSRKI